MAGDWHALLVGTEARFMIARRNN